MQVIKFALRYWPITAALGVTLGAVVFMFMSRIRMFDNLMEINRDHKMHYTALQFDNWSRKWKMIGALAGVLFLAIAILGGSVFISDWISGDSLLGAFSEQSENSPTPSNNATVPINQQAQTQVSILPQQKEGKETFSYNLYSEHNLVLSVPLGTKAFQFYVSPSGEQKDLPTDYYQNSTGRMGFDIHKVDSASTTIGFETKEKKYIIQIPRIIPGGANQSGSVIATVTAR